MEVNDQFSEKAKEDFRLINQALAGEEHAYAALMERYRNSVYFMVLKMVKNEDDAEDITMEAFSRAFRYLPRFEQRLSFSSWLFRIATNNCVDFLRKKQRMGYNLSTDPEHGSSIAQNLKDEEPNPHELTAIKERHALIRNFVNKLPPKYRVLIEMRFFDELGYEEIADRLGIPLGTTKARLHRAKELLTDIIKIHPDQS